MNIRVLLWIGTIILFATGVALVIVDFQVLFERENERLFDLDWEIEHERKRSRDCSNTK